jgi:hypothetical protein
MRGGRGLDRRMGWTIRLFAAVPWLAIFFVLAANDEAPRWLWLVAAFASLASAAVGFAMRRR